MDIRRTAPLSDAPQGRRTPRTGQVAHLLMWLLLWFAAVLAAQALREAFVFVPGFVPWDGESPRGFAVFLGGAAGFTALALWAGWGIIPVRAAVRRFTDGLGLCPASRRQALRWAAAGLATAVLVGAAGQAVTCVPSLTSVPAGQDARILAVAQTSFPVRLGYGLLAPAPLEKLFYRAPLLALWLALASARERGAWAGRRWVRRPLTGAATCLSAVLFAAGHAMGGSANVAHAAFFALAATAVTLWQRSLIPALAAHGLYDAYAYAWE
ncbi:CPBP family glutamic-type intramembrane protease [Streptomyces sp. cg36]|uniref:CPBP family glutamic-type intramembrane protease n=1 Tax=Streptomyces sp. cg36 TaxID=3238798 RepID=UPI0034E1E057